MKGRVLQTLGLEEAGITIPHQVTVVEVILIHRLRLMRAIDVGTVEGIIQAGIITIEIEIAGTTGAPEITESPDLQDLITAEEAMVAIMALKFLCGKICVTSFDQNISSRTLQTNEKGLSTICVGFKLCTQQVLHELKKGTIHPTTKKKNVVLRYISMISKNVFCLSIRHSTLLNVKKE